MRYYKFDPVTKQVTRITDPWGSPENLAKAFEIQNRRVALTEVPGGEVSTVFLGLDHSWGEGPPLLFETMPYVNGAWKEEHMRRYSTYSEALVGHMEVVEELLGGRVFNPGNTDGS